MKKQFCKRTILVVFVCLIMAWASTVSSHCQIPCGIYDDQMRITMIVEHITTIEKSMRQIVKLSAQDKADANQLARWIANKEKHTDKLSEIVTYYFMTQRIKPVQKTQGEKYDNYIQKLTGLHEMLVFNMKARQTTDLENVEKLRSILARFQRAYFQEGKPL